MIENMEGQITFADLDSQFMKTSPEPSQATAAEIGKRSSRKSLGSQNQMLPMFLCLNVVGAKQDASMEWTDGGALRGAFTTRSFGEYPSVVNESRLSQILEECPPRKYSLSAKACQGILTRAARRGKQLPEALRLALETNV